MAESIKFKLTVSEIRALIRAAEFTSNVMTGLCPGGSWDGDVHPMDSAAMKLSVLLVKEGKELR
jgi:hypothetical protein